MKKTLFLIIAFCMLLSVALCGCDAFESPVDIENDPIEDKPSELDPDNDTTEDNGKENEEAPLKYWELQCYPTKTYVERHFSIDGASSDIELSLSSEWSIEESADGYDIFRGGNKIGEMVRGEADASAWKSESNLKRDNGGSFIAHKIIESSGKGADTEYRYRFKYEFKSGDQDCCITLVADYTEVDANAADALYISAKLNSSSAATEGLLSDLQDKTILILGNSFISSSSIGTALEDIVYSNGKELQTVAISRGYASVQTYVEDADMMESISSGTYGGVFICGFYSNPEVQHLKTLKAACDASDTPLIIFPAHNEERSVITSAQKACPDLITLDWKAEVDALIDSGLSRWYFCIDDQHQHSTELAGVVGAFMIYRAIYGEIPNLDNSSVVDFTGAREIIGSYLTDGKAEPAYEVLYL